MRACANRGLSMADAMTFCPTRWVTTGGRPLCILVCIVVVLAAGLDLVQSRLVADIVRADAQSDSVTLEEYEQPEVGQAVAEVDAILFDSGRLGDSDADRNMRFQNGDGSEVSLSFADGRLWRSSQSGLTPGGSESAR